jgi:hypothetical protein
MKKLFIAFTLSLLVLGGISRAAELDVIGVGAVSMGMGKTGLALFDDVNALYLNPAGLSKIEIGQFTSMYTRCLDEVSYVVAGGAVPLQYGTLGVSYIAADTTDIPLTTLLSDGSLDQDNITFAGYSSSILALSYGRDIGPEETGLSSGLKLKYFSEGFSRGRASGYDLDLGFRFQPVPWLRLALLQENCLPASLGATLNWSTGLKEGLPTVTKGALGLVFDERNLRLEAGVEKQTFSACAPVLCRGGVEWRPVSILVFRVGCDQEPVPSENGGASGTTNNVSYGTGFRYAGFGFDYAFRPFAGYAGNNAHFFSISYLGKADYTSPDIEYKFVSGRICRKSKLQLGIRLSEAVKDLKATLPDGTTVTLSPSQKNLAMLEWTVPDDLPLGRQQIELFARDLAGNKSLKTIEFNVAAIKPELDVQQPPDRAITSEESVVVSGRVLNGELLLNGQPVALESDGSFKTSVKLNLGVNKISAKVSGEEGVDATRELSVLRIIKEEAKNNEQKTK